MKRELPHGNSLFIVYTVPGNPHNLYFWPNPCRPMENAIKFLRIQNFKSIKDVTLHPRRVNLVIGEPNVGKSNLLEAMTLLGGITYEQTEKFMGSFIRYEEPRQLFYDNLVRNTIKVETDKDVAVLPSGPGRRAAPRLGPAHLQFRPGQSVHQLRPRTGPADRRLPHQTRWPGPRHRQRLHRAPLAHGQMGTHLPQPGR